MQSISKFYVQSISHVYLRFSCSSSKTLASAWLSLTRPLTLTVLPAISLRKSLSKDANQFPTLQGLAIALGVQSMCHNLFHWFQGQHPSVPAYLSGSSSCILPSGSRSSSAPGKYSSWGKNTGDSFLHQIICLTVPSAKDTFVPTPTHLQSLHDFFLPIILQVSIQMSLSSFFTLLKGVPAFQ